ncbi:unnamed protein product [Acanthoscelides obtectus]|uniref:MADF domain-containing protein n=1 Tax=Acanthoscelides obtectus TaxID=200917 RepID=A0A9P0JGF4_ACAOB|nr:unnamed protein product [Acanthoscelides obtectus]CAK1661446.1 hypothetical protein AOBTE_LOCUS22629 [Acanthoscelides obtectus]
MSKELDTELLIALIEARPVLWDKTSPIYKNRNETKEAWKEVCIEMNSDFHVYSEEEKNKYGKEVVKRWVNIRDAFNKFLKKEKSFKKSGSGASTLSKYIYAEQLKFLTKIFTHRSTEDSLSANPVQATSDADVSETDTENNNTQLKSPPRKQLGSRKRKIDDVELRMIKALEQPEDRHISFFKGIVPSLHTFTDDETLQFQTGVLRLITNIKQRRFQSNQSLPCAGTSVYDNYINRQNSTEHVHRSTLSLPKEPPATPSGICINRNMPAYTTTNYPHEANAREYFEQYNPTAENPSSVDSASTQDSVYADLDFT